MLQLDDDTFQAFLMEMDEFIQGYYGMDDWEPPSYEDVEAFFSDQGYDINDDIYNFLLDFDPEMDPNAVPTLMDMLGIS